MILLLGRLYAKATACFAAHWEFIVLETLCLRFSRLQLRTGYPVWWWRAETSWLLYEIVVYTHLRARYELYIISDNKAFGNS